MFVSFKQVTQDKNARISYQQESGAKQHSRKLGWWVGRTANFAEVYIFKIEEQTQADFRGPCQNKNSHVFLECLDLAAIV